MSEKANYYGSLSMVNVQEAFKEVAQEILGAQQNLRNVQENHTLLRLIKIDLERDRIDFDKRFGQHISHWKEMSLEEMGNWYSGLGHYIDLLESEVNKYSKLQPEISSN